ncbi:uncharacterized membrane-bound protein conserved in bacteria [Fructobacillus pseudoficulneus]|uniref:Uncharacterized membrane-bound protein conserved in bacteria n=1 Tax=Fructobacillus pseudoficulneus TaxID=220714 RepID=A0A3F3H1S8_9LACO|nr:DUF1129 family protein [Fructobacillus pseudoficulneus]GAP02548.1 uncharacterized membrane-bound protein conserved in bacteria [Fructobacillus pseudoficulneus]SEH47222.1 Uncharacterized membrane-anchored protein [Fructobacillus pseudoficulneus]
MTQLDSQLSKKNQDFMFRFQKGMAETDKLDDEQKQEIIQAVANRLYTGQKAGQTAAQIYGSPATLLQKYLNPARLAKKFHDYSFTFLAADTALVLIMFLSGFFAITMGLGKSSAQSEGLGVLSVLLLSIWGGVIYTLAMQRLVPNPKAEQTKKKLPTWLLLIVVAVLWIVGFSAFLLIPAAINPTLPLFGYVVMLALSWLAYLLNRKHAGFEHGGILAISKLAQQARIDAEAAKKE